MRNSDSSVVGTATFRNGLYTLDCTKHHPKIIPHKPQVALLSTSLQLLHERLAHVNASGIKSMFDRGGWLRVLTLLLIPALMKIVSVVSLANHIEHPFLMSVTVVQLNFCSSCILCVIYR